MAKTEVHQKLVSPQITAQVAKRIGRCVGAKVTAASSYRFTNDSYKRIESVKNIISFSLGTAPAGTVFAAVEHPLGLAYGRKTMERSGCPVLQARHGHLGRFIIAKCSSDSTQNTEISGVIYEDATKSHQDVLIRTKFNGKLGDMLNVTRIPDVLKSRDMGLKTDGTDQPCSLSETNRLSELLSGSLITIDPFHIAFLNVQYGNRVAQYANEYKDPAFGLIPHQLHTDNTGVCS